MIILFLSLTAARWAGEAEASLGLSQFLFQIPVRGRCLFIKETIRDNPRIWILNNATAPISKKKWNQAMIHFQQMSGWELGLPAH